MGGADACRDGRIGSFEAAFLCDRANAFAVNALIIFAVVIGLAFEAVEIFAGTVAADLVGIAFWRACKLGIATNFIFAIVAEASDVSIHALVTVFAFTDVTFAVSAEAILCAFASFAIFAFACIVDAQLVRSADRVANVCARTHGIDAVHAETLCIGSALRTVRKP